MHSMKYSSIEFEVNIPETQIACELESNVVDLPQRSVKEHIEYALDNPIGAGDISTVVQKGDKVAIIISDVTRKWQAIPTYLPILVDRLNLVTREHLTGLMVIRAFGNQKFEEKRFNGTMQY